MRRALALTFTLALVRCGSAPAPEPAPAPPAPSEPAAAAPAPSESVTVTASALNVRRDPSTTADVIAQVKKGDRLTVVLRDAGWVKVTTPGGESGWVAAQHVSSSVASTATARPRPRRGGCPPDSEFQFTKTPTPTFSDRGAHGLVVVDATVDTKGNVVATKIVSNNTGDEALGFLAEREIKSAKFAPPIRNCVPRSFIFTYKRSF